MARKTQRETIMRLHWALDRIAAATDIPADKRKDLAWLQSACSLARVYARAALAGRPLPINQEQDESL